MKEGILKRIFAVKPITLFPGEEAAFRRNDEAFKRLAKHREELKKGFAKTKDDHTRLLIRPR